MSFSVSPDRILVTNTSGATFFDTNRVMPHFVAEVISSQTLAFPAAVYDGYSSIAERAPTFHMWHFNNWTSTVALGNVPSGLASPIVYCEIESVQTVVDQTSVAANVATLARGSVAPVQTGRYNCFNSMVIEQQMGRLQAATPITSGQIPGVYSHKVRLVNFYVSGTTLYMQLRQASKTLSGSAGVVPGGGTFATVGPWIVSNTAATFEFNIHAYIGSMS